MKFNDILRTKPFKEKVRFQRMILAMPPPTEAEVEPLLAVLGWGAHGTWRFRDPVIEMSPFRIAELMDMGTGNRSGRTPLDSAMGILGRELLEIAAEREPIRIGPWARFANRKMSARILYLAIRNIRWTDSPDAFCRVMGWCLDSTEIVMAIAAKAKMGGVVVNADGLELSVSELYPGDNGVPPIASMLYGRVGKSLHQLWVEIARAEREGWYGLT